MRTDARKARIVAVFAALLTVVLGAGCRGFFVNPTLTSIAIGPQTPTVVQSQTLQFSASGNYSDGSSKTLTNNVSWSSSDSSCATINSNGLLTALAVSNICTTIISASSGTLTAATTTVTVTPGTPVSITLTASPTNPAQNGTVAFTANAVFPGNSTPQDITTSVTWSNSDPTNLTLTNGSGNGVISATAPHGDVINVSASFSGVTSNIVAITVQ
ncbi:MAG: Ig-like domain-containing protein [Acidobacteriales bacterium]|nr:Ig-like domain-containing protein [Terriglobales bacterium]